MRLKFLAFALALLPAATMARTPDAPAALFVDSRSTTVRAAADLSGNLGLALLLPAACYAVIGGYGYYARAQAG